MNKMYQVTRSKRIVENHNEFKKCWNIYCKALSKHQFENHQLGESITNIVSTKFEVAGSRLYHETYKYIGLLWLSELGNPCISISNDFMNNYQPPLEKMFYGLNLDLLTILLNHFIINKQWILRLQKEIIRLI